jgi:hypothetical protein
MHQKASKLNRGTAGLSKFQLEDRDFAPEFLDRESSSEPDVGPSAYSPINRGTEQERIDSPSLGGSPNPKSNSQPVPIPLTPLQKLEEKWNNAAAAVGAASLTLFNDIDSSIPQLKQSFVYSEMDLHW